MSNRILDYPEATAITSDDYILLDNAGTGAKCIKASALNVNMDNYTIKEASGAIASFDDGEDLPLAFMGAYITALQDLHGYDAPWVGGAGKNKFDSDTVLSAFTKNNNKYVGKPSYVVDDYVISGGFKTNTRYTLSYKAYNNTSTPSNFRFIFSYTDGTEEIIGGFVDTTTEKVIVGTSAENKTISKIKRNYSNGVDLTLYDIQLEEGSTATTFAPYSNICPIIGWSAVNVTVADATTSPTVSNVYTLTFTDGSNPLTVYGGTVDLISGVLTVDRAFVDLGTLNWSYSSISERFYVGASDLGVKATDASTPFNAISSALIAKSYNEIEAKTVDYAIAINPNATQLFARYSSITSASDFITAMNGVQLVYELATPLTYQLTPQMIYSLIGENNIFADTGDSIVDYRKLWVKPEM